MHTRPKMDLPGGREVFLLPFPLPKDVSHHKVYVGSSKKEAPLLRATNRLLLHCAVRDQRIQCNFVMFMYDQIYA